MATTRPGSWIKKPGAYSTQEIEDLLAAGMDHAWLQFHQGRDLAAEGGASIVRATPSTTSTARAPSTGWVGCS